MSNGTTNGNGKELAKDLEEAGLYILMEDISMSSCKDVIRFIVEKNLEVKSSQALKLIISSNGGDLSAAFALIDTIKGSKIPIHTVGLGVIASAGLLIFISGEPGKRVLTPNTSILSHQYTWGTYGKEHELFSVQREFELTTERMLDHYKKCTGMTENDIRKTLLPPQDVWLSAKEAKKYGLCDTIKTIY
tara:strand:- start:2972 stop:3541 length:570 start_codon:yes stop_codon:yes gene_type:complete